MPTTGLFSAELETRSAILLPIPLLLFIRFRLEEIEACTIDIERFLKISGFPASCGKRWASWSRAALR